MVQISQSSVNYSNLIRSNIIFFRLFTKKIVPLTQSVLFSTINEANNTKYHFKYAYKEKGSTWLENLVERSPKHYHPYMKLMRLDRPIGTWLLYIPCMWGIALATPLGSFPSVYMLSLFGAGAILMRGAGCTINDIWDRDFDKHVDRTRNRPLTSGAVSLPQAFIFLAGQMGLSLAILLQFNWHSVFLGLASTVLVVTYPLFKRFTYWPQIVLGFTFNYGALLGYSAVMGTCHWPLTLPLYISGLCWTMVYDTIYALQDIEDDKLLGLKSTAIYFGDNCKIWMSGFGLGMCGLLVLTGCNYGAGPIYYCGLSLAMLHIVYQLYTLDIKDRMHCLNIFKSNRNTGLTIFSAIVLDRAFSCGLPIF